MLEAIASSMLSVPNVASAVLLFENLACCLIKSLVSLSVFLKLPFSDTQRRITKKFPKFLFYSVVFAVTNTDSCYLIKPLRFVLMPSQFCITVYLVKLFETCLT